MGVFGAIRNAIFGHAEAAKTTAQTGQVTLPPGNQPGQSQYTGSQPQPVNAEAALTQIAAQKGNPNLNWRSSIVDLMKLLDLDSSLDNRRELATELGYTGDKDGSAEMNIWLHKAVMKKLEENGGKVSADLKD